MPCGPSKALLGAVSWQIYGVRGCYSYALPPPSPACTPRPSRPARHPLLTKIKSFHIWNSFKSHTDWIFVHFLFNIFDIFLFMTPEFCWWLSTDDVETSTYLLGTENVETFYLLINIKTIHSIVIGVDWAHFELLSPICYSFFSKQNHLLLVWKATYNLSN